MARTATARAGTGKGTAKAKGGTKPPPKKTPKKTARKRAKRAPNGQGKNPPTQQAFLATVKAENPTITSEALAEQFKIPLEDVARMRHFVHEYIKDFNATQAALRMGYAEDFAGSTGLLLLHHSFTQLRLGEVLDRMEADAIVGASTIMAGLLREANQPDSFCANSSSRIKAWQTLAKIKGMDAPRAPAPKDATPGGGVMLVPIAVHPEEWEEHARRSQKELKNAVILDAEIVR